MSQIPEIKPCPCCGADLIGGPRDNSDNAGEFFYYHRANNCALERVCIWPHNADSWNTRSQQDMGALDEVALENILYEHLGSERGSVIGIDESIKAILSALE